MSVNEQRNTPSTYGVFVSETGNTVADFTQSPLLTVTDTELNAWTAHTLDLPLVNGTEYDPIAMESLILNFEPRRNVVIEEFTGMWCGFCPQGIVAFDILEEKNQGWRAIRVQTDVQVAGKYPRQRKSQCGRPHP